MEIGEGGTPPSLQQMLDAADKLRVKAIREGDIETAKVKTEEMNRIARKIGGS